jgi:hypothetical protein
MGEEKDMAPQSLTYAKLSSLRVGKREALHAVALKSKGWEGCGIKGSMILSQCENGVFSGTTY